MKKLGPTPSNPIAKLVLACLTLLRFGVLLVGLFVIWFMLTTGQSIVVSSIVIFFIIMAYYKLGKVRKKLAIEWWYSELNENKRERIKILLSTSDLHRYDEELMDIFFSIRDQYGHDLSESEYERLMVEAIERKENHKQE